MGSCPLGTKDAGGLVGTATLTAPLSVSNCTFASLVKSNEKAAGFFGYLKCDNHLNLAETNQVVQVNNGYLNVEANKYAGGMFGYVYGDIKTSGLCLININVTATSNFAGGIIGELEHGTLETKTSASITICRCMATTLPADWSDMPIAVRSKGI